MSSLDNPELFALQSEKMTPQMKMTPTEVLDQLLETLSTWKIKHKSTITEFSIDLERHPSSAFSFSAAAFTAAAYLHVIDPVVTAIQKKRLALGKAEDGATLGGVCKSLRSDVMSRAKYPSRSTSVTTVLMAQEQLAAVAEILDLVAAYINVTSL
jgi:hypothetical protein